MPVLSPDFLNPLKIADIPIINLHPALPGAFNGAASYSSRFAISAFRLQSAGYNLWAPWNLLTCVLLQNAIERAHKDWIEGKIDKTGVMIHRVISEVDMGAPILVQEIPFVKGIDEDLEALKQRIHEVEWKAIVSGTALAIKELLVGRAREEGTE